MHQKKGTWQKGSVKSAHLHAPYVTKKQKHAGPLSRNLYLLSFLAFHEVDIDAPQRVHCPFGVCALLYKEVLEELVDELRESVLQDTLPHLPHESQLVCCVMDRHQVASDSLFRYHRVQVRPRV